MGGIEFGWVDTGGQIQTRVDGWIEGWTGGFGEDGWFWGRRVGAGVDGWLRMGGRVAKNGWTGGLKWV